MRYIALAMLLTACGPQLPCDGFSGCMAFGLPDGGVVYAIPLNEPDGGVNPNGDCWLAGPQWTDAQCCPGLQTFQGTVGPACAIGCVGDAPCG